MPFMQKAISRWSTTAASSTACSAPPPWPRSPSRRRGFIRHLPLFLSGLTEGRSLPAIAAEPFRDRFHEIEQPAGAKEKAAFYAGCLIDFAYPEMGEAVVKVLNTAGHRGDLPRGADLLRRPGPLQRRLRGGRAERRWTTSKALEDRTVRWIVSACPTCTVALRHEFVVDARGQGHDRLGGTGRGAGREGPGLLVPGEGAGRRGAADRRRRPGAPGGHLPRLLPPEADAPWPTSRRASCWAPRASRSGR